MGATGWDYFVPYQADISAALQRLRADVFARGAYGCSEEISATEFKAAPKGCGSDLQSLIDTFAKRAADPNTPPQTRNKFLASIEELKQIGGTDVPKKPTPQAGTIQELLALQGEAGTHSILDIDRVGAKPAFRAVAALSGIQLIEIFGSEQPSHEEIESNYEDGALEEYICNRWQGIYIVAYRDGVPNEIFFAGCSGD